MGVTIKLKNLLAVTFIGLFGAILFVFSDKAQQGVIKGLTLCFNTVVPSLFLLTALSIFLARSGVLQRVGRLVSPLTKKILGINGEQTAVFFLSLVSGYPVGAKMLNSLYKSGKICRKKTLFMLPFCVNAGPAFVIFTVGGILGSKSDGNRLFLAMVLSSIWMAVFCSVFLRKVEDEYTPNSQNVENMSDCFVLSVSDAAVTLFNVSAFVVVFSGVIEILNGINWDSKLKTAVLSLLEVTVGVGNCNRSNLEAVAFLVGFGGVSVILQVKSQAGEINPSLLFLFLSRIVVGSLMAGFILLFETVSPRDVQTVVFESGNKSVNLSANPFAVGALILMAITLVVSVGQQNNKYLKTQINSDIL